jgi:hypothetical protein
VIEAYKLAHPEPVIAPPAPDLSQPPLPAGVVIDPVTGSPVLQDASA